MSKWYPAVSFNIAHAFYLTLLAQMLTPLTLLAGMLMLFDRFKQLGHWNAAEVMLCFASIHMAFALSECFARGFDQFSQLVIQGDFDRILVRPRNTVLQVLGAKIELTRFGRMLLSGIVLMVSINSLNLTWTPLKLITLVPDDIGRLHDFHGVFMLAAALCFWTMQGLEVANVFTDGGREMSQYPLDIYRQEVTRFFTFVIPFAAVNYLPLQYILDRPGSAAWQAVIPLVSVLFLIPCILLWRLGVRHYQSSGS